MRTNRIIYSTCKIILNEYEGTEKSKRKNYETSDNKRVDRYIMVELTKNEMRKIQDFRAKLDKSRG